MNTNHTEQLLDLLIKNVKTHYWELISDEQELTEIQLGEGSLYESLIFRYNKFLHTFNIDSADGYPLIGPFSLNSDEGSQCKILFDIILDTIKNPKYGEIDKASLADTSHWFIQANFPVCVNKERNFFLSL